MYPVSIIQDLIEKSIACQRGWMQLKSVVGKIVENMEVVAFMLKKWGQLFYVHVMLSVSVLLSCTMNQNRVTTQSAEALTFYQQGVKDYYNHYFQRAVRHFSRAIQIDSSFALAHCRLGISFLKLGDRSAAEKHLLRANQYFSSVTNKEKLFIKICRFELQGDFQNRTVLLRECVRKYARDPECHLLLAEDCSRRYLHNQAEACLGEVLRLDPENLPAHKLLAYTYSKFNQFEKAKIHIQKCLKIDSNDADALVTMGDIYRLNGDYENAQQSYYRAIEILPNFQRAHLKLGELYLETFQWEKSLQQLHLAYELLPFTLSNRAEQYARIAEVYLLMDRIENAERSAVRALDLNNENVRALAVQGKIHLEKSEIDAARKCADQIKEIIEVEKRLHLFSDAAFYDLLGEIAYREQNWQKAIEGFQLAWQHSPEELAMHYQSKLAENYLRIGNFQRVKYMCDLMLCRNPGFPFAHFILARVLEHSENFASAHDEYRKFISLAAGTNRYSDELKYAQKKLLAVDRGNFAVAR